MDRDARGFMYTLSGEHAMLADKAEKKARDLEHEAEGQRAIALHHRERSVWAEMAGDALDPDAGPRADRES